eukprot:7173131-Pyramimonas_sp.AAC.1
MYPKSIDGYEPGLQGALNSWGAGQHSGFTKDDDKVGPLQPMLKQYTRPSYIINNTLSSTTTMQPILMKHIPH